MKYFRKVVVAAIELMFGATVGMPLALANPSGAQVVAGSATIAHTAPNVLQVHNAPGTVINWQHFSIAQGETTRFIQQSAQSAVLNRVVGGNLSEIMGTLQSNGQVFLINPSGIVIGPNAVIDTQGFVASTLAISDVDFINQRLRFSAGLSAGDIRNEGTIRTAAGGRVALIAPQIENTGLIDAPNGDIVLVAGQSVTLSDAVLGGISFEVQAPDDSVVNMGTLSADGGAVKVFAGTLRQGGQVRADRLALGDDGQIMLVASHRIEVEAGASVSAQGQGDEDGGRIVVDAGTGEARVAGTLSAASADRAGGAIDVLGAQVELAGGASVDVSGAMAGGEVRIGGDYQGRNEAVRNAHSTDIEQGVRINADARDSGDGGRVIVWADEATHFAGDLSARGGAQAGNGGFAEVSGKVTLRFSDAAGVDLSAAHGSTGMLLLDPRDIIIASNGGQVIEAVDELCDFVASCGEGWRDLGDNLVTIKASTLAGLNADVTLQAGSSIFVLEDVTLTAPGASLTLMAALDGSVNQDFSDEGMIWQAGRISTSGGDVTLSGLRVLSTGGIATQGGDVRIGYLEGNALGAAEMAYVGGGISTAGGQVSLRSSGDAELSGAALNSGGGAVAIDAGAGFFRSSATLQSAGGDVRIEAAQGITVSGIDAGSGRIELTTSQGSLSASGLRAASADLKARFGINATANVSQRIDAASNNGHVNLSTFGGDALLSVGTVSSTFGVSLFGWAGVRQASGGSVTAPSVSVSAENGTIATSSAPLNVSASSVTLAPLRGAAHVVFAPSSLNALVLNGSAAALAGSTLSYAGLGLTLSAGSGALNLGLGDTSLSSLRVRVGDADLNVAAIDTPDTDLDFESVGSIVLEGAVTASALQALASVDVTTADMTISGSLYLSAGGSAITGRLAADSISIVAGNDVLFDHLTSDTFLNVNASFGNIDTRVDRAGYDIEYRGTSGLELTAGLGLGTQSSIEIDAPNAGFISLAGFDQGIGTRDSSLTVHSTGWLSLSTRTDIVVDVGRSDSGVFTPTAISGLDIYAYGSPSSQRVFVDAANIKVDLENDGGSTLLGTVRSIEAAGNAGSFGLESQVSLDLLVQGSFNDEFELRSNGSLRLSGASLSVGGNISLYSDGALDVMTALTSSGSGIGLFGGLSVSVGGPVTSAGVISISSSGDISFAPGASISGAYVSLTGVDIGQAGVATVITSTGTVSLRGRNILATVNGASGLNLTSYGISFIEIDSFALNALSLDLSGGATGRIYDADITTDIVSYATELSGQGGRFLTFTAPQHPVSLNVLEDGSSALTVSADTLGGSLTLTKFQGDVLIQRIDTGWDSTSGSVEIRASTGSIYAVDSFDGGTIDVRGDDDIFINPSAHVGLYAYNGSVGRDTAVYGGEVDVRGAADVLDIEVRNTLNVRSTEDGDLDLYIDASGTGLVDLRHAASGLSITRDSQTATVSVLGASAGEHDLDLQVVNGALAVLGNVSAADLSLSASSALTIEAGTGALTVSARESMRLSAGGPLTISAGTGAFHWVHVVSGASMDIDGGQFIVSGGSGERASADLEAGTRMTINTASLSVLGGSGEGASALMRADGQFVRSGDVLIQAGTGRGAHAGLASAGCVLSSGNCFDPFSFFGSASQRVSASSLRILGSTEGNAFIVNGMTLDEDDGYLFVSGGPLQQAVDVVGDIVITGGHGAANWHESGIRNASSGAQSVSAGGEVNLSSLTDAVYIDGDRTAEIGIRNDGGVGQQIFANSIRILNQARDGYVGVAIDSVSGFYQDVYVDGSISIVNDSSSGLAGITQRAPDGAQFIDVSGERAGTGGNLTVNASGGGQATVFAQGHQTIDLEPYDSDYQYDNDWNGDLAGLFNGGTSGTVSVGGGTSLGQSGIVSMGAMQELYAGEISVIGGASQGASAVISSAGAQTLEAWKFDPETKAFGGSLVIGSVQSSGSSEVTATQTQDILAGSVRVNGGQTSAALARIEAGERITLSTMGGGIVVQAGSQGSAKIDPPDVSIVSTGGLETIAGGPGTSASIVGGNSLTVASLGGNTVLSGASGASSGIDSAGLLNVISAGDVVVSPNGGDAAFSAVNGGSVRVGAPTCSGCSSISNFRGGSFSFGGLRGQGVIVVPPALDEAEDQAKVAVDALIALISARQDRSLYDDDFAEVNALSTASGEDQNKRKVGACK